MSEKKKVVRLHDPDDEFQLSKADPQLIFDAAVQFTNSGYEYSLQAYKMLIALIKRDPEYKDINGDNPYFYLGLIYSRNNKTIDEAIECFTKSTEIDPTDGSAYENRGYCWYEKGNLKQALADLKYAEEVDEKSGRGEVIIDSNLIEEIENKLKKED
jgi:tetratricopeptide (TPR) repeat protein